MNIAIIPARGGSKRIPRKNIKTFFGKPMIAYSITAAIESHLFEHVIVSTDDDEIATVARQLGAEVPFIRPENLSNDFAGTTEVIAHATQWAIDQSFAVDAVCCIYATAPFVQISDLKRSFSMLQSGSWSYVFTVTDFDSPIFRSFKLIDDGGLEMFFPEYFSKRSQELPTAYHDAGQFYWGKPNAWIENQCIFDKHSTAIMIPRWRVQDIDTHDDWVRAEIVYKILQGTSHEV